MKSLVIYYSLEGTTRMVSQAVASELNADLLRLRPRQDLKARGFLKYPVGGFQAIFQRKPELEPVSKNLRQYDLVVLGTPVWAGHITPAVRSYLTGQRELLAKKKIALFCCHRGNKGRTFADIKDLLPGVEVISTAEFAHVVRDQEQALDRARGWARRLRGLM